MRILESPKSSEQPSKGTGGQYFGLSKKDTVDKIYFCVEEDLRNKYRLGYPPDKNGGPGVGLLRVRTKRIPLVVEPRDGDCLGQWAQAPTKCIFAGDPLLESTCEKHKGQ